MPENEIKWHTLEKHLTKDIHDGHVNGSLIPVWRNWDEIITVQPEMVYVTSINPGEISLSAPSMRRATNGIAAMVSGTEAALMPIDVPTSMRVKGMLATIKMMKGIERPILVIIPNTWLSTGIARICRGRVT